MICKSCKLDKDLSNFHYNSNHKKYVSSCKSCTNQNRRKLYKEKVGEFFNYTKSKEKLKRCCDCNELKELNSTNFPKATNSFAKYCRECSKIRRKNRRKPLNRPRYINSAHSVISRCRTNDTHSKRENRLTVDFVNESLLQPCIYCGYKSTGLDRINNEIGHTIENCVPCCKECNIARNRLFSFEEMKEIGQIIKKIKDNRLNSLE